MAELSLWLLFGLIGLGTFALRFSFIYFFGRIEMPAWLRRALRYVPASVLAALVVPALTHPTGVFDVSLSNVRLLAGLGAAVVAWRTRNVLWTLVTGMALLWILGAISQATPERRLINDVVLPDAKISRAHACITFDAQGDASIRDLGSTNGTYINGVRITQAALAPGIDWQTIYVKNSLAKESP